MSSSIRILLVFHRLPAADRICILNRFSLDIRGCYHDSLCRRIGIKMMTSFGNNDSRGSRLKISGRRIRIHLILIGHLNLGCRIINVQLHRLHGFVSRIITYLYIHSYIAAVVFCLINAYLSLPVIYQILHSRIDFRISKQIAGLGLYSVLFNPVINRLNTGIGSLILYMDLHLHPGFLII